MFPVPPYQLYLCGAALVDSISLGPLLPNVGLFHIVYSSVQDKKGTINLSFTACRDMLPDPAFYANCLQQSFEELRAGALEARKKKRRRKAGLASRSAQPALYQLVHVDPGLEPAGQHEHAPELAVKENCI